MSTISRLRLANFTAFSSFDHTFTPGITVITGANGSGKTHILKLIYAACAITVGEGRDYSFAQKIIGVFRPYQNRIGRLSKRHSHSVKSSVLIETLDGRKLILRFSNHTKEASRIFAPSQHAWSKHKIIAAYIPVKEMLAHAPGFVATTSRRELAFEDVYPDIVKLAFLPTLKGPMKGERKALLGKLQKAISGKVVVKGEHFFLKNDQGELEFSLLAEGIRKLALIWLLIQNGTLLNGSILLWDEPEANLNPTLMEQLVEVILELQRNGVQVVITTHNSVLLRYFHLKKKSTDDVNFLNLIRNEDGTISYKSAKNISGLEGVAINQALDSLFDLEVKASVDLGL